jgi:hypothetical protein
MAEAQAQVFTVDPTKWLATLQTWTPAEPLGALVAFINSLINAAGPARVQGLDGLIAHTGATTRSGREKLERLRKWSEKMRADPQFWPQHFVRRRDVSIRIKAIIDKAPRPLNRFEVERKYRKFAPVPATGLSQELKEMARRGEIDRFGQGLYWRKGTAGNPVESQAQQIYRLVHDAPGHRMRTAELVIAMDIRRLDLQTLIAQMRKRWRDPPLFEHPTGDGIIAASVESLSVLKRVGRIVDGRGGVFFSLPKVLAAHAESAKFTTLRPERPHVDSEHLAREVVRLRGLKNTREQSLALDASAKTLGVPRAHLELMVHPLEQVINNPERKATKRAPPKNAELRYFQLIEAQPGKAPEPRAVLEKKMMADFNVSRAEARYCRARAIKRYNSLHRDNPCKWDGAGR